MDAASTCGLSPLSTLTAREGDTLVLGRFDLVGTAAMAAAAACNVIEIADGEDPVLWRTTQALVLVVRTRAVHRLSCWRVAASHVLGTQIVELEEGARHVLASHHFCFSG